MAQDPRGITNNELILRRVTMKSFRSQHSFLKENWLILFNNSQFIERDIKTIKEDSENRTLVLKGEGYSEDSEEYFDAFRDTMGVYALVESMKPQISKVSTIGYISSFRKNKIGLDKYGVGYDIQGPKQYTELFGDLQLSNYKGSITRTTKLDILNIVNDGVKKNLTVGEIGKQISGLNKTVFSQNRANMIATTEVGKAYEYGNYLPMKQAQGEGAEVSKRRLTVGDSRVRPTHRQAQAEGRKPMDYIFGSVGQGFPPAGVRCRCTTEYKIK